MKLLVEVKPGLDLREALRRAFRRMRDPKRSAWKPRRRKDGSLTMLHVRHGSVHIRARKGGASLVRLSSNQRGDAELFRAFCGFLQRHLEKSWQAIRRVE